MPTLNPTQPINQTKPHKTQVADLRRAFDLWSLSVPPDDRSPFPLLGRWVLSNVVGLAE